MDTAEALGLLETELEPYRAMTYAQLAAQLDAGDLHLARVGPGGTAYQVEIQCLWDGEPGGNLRVIGSIDDGGWRAFAPLTRSFIKAPDGAFIGE